MPDRAAPLPVITLLTDFGLSDTYVGVMKGVILGIAPQARMVDLTHDISPQNILEGSARLATAIDFFPPGTVHLAVVDPGVGSSRAALVVETAVCRFVAPDNGLLTLPLRHLPPARVIRLTEKAARYTRQPVSATFHGRDIFAPIAAHLAAGVPADALGNECAPEEIIWLPLPETTTQTDSPARTVLRIPVLYSDRFGNLITDLTPARWAEWLRAQGEVEATAAQRVQIRAGNRQWQGLVRTYTDVAVGAPLAYWGSAGRLEIGIREGDAAFTLGLSSGDTFQISLV